MATVETFTTAGNQTWVCPVGVTTVQVECWGGGATGSNADEGGPGGGGGAYTRTNAYPVTGGSTYNLRVAAADTSQSSWFDSTSGVFAEGGGSAGTSTGGRASQGIGDVKFSGGNGGNIAAAGPDGGGGGSSAGPGGAGSDGAITAGGSAGSDAGAGGNGGSSGNAGSGGSAPGGGGGGPGQGSNTTGQGARGQVRLTYTVGTVVVAAGAAIFGGQVTHKRYRAMGY